MTAAGALLADLRAAGVAVTVAADRRALEVELAALLALDVGE